MIQIRCKNNNNTYSFPEGSSLLEIYQKLQPELNIPYQVVSAKVNNASQGLKFRVYQSRDIEFVGLNDPAGMRIYTRSLCFVLYKACSEIFPESRLYIEHSISNGYYCNFYTRAADHATADDVERIRQRMQQIIDGDSAFHHREAPTEDAVRIFREHGNFDKVKLLETSDRVYSDYYLLDDTVDYYYGPLLPSTGYIGIWGLEKYQDGLLLRVPDMKNPTILAPKVDQPRTFETFAEYVRWSIIMGLSNVGDVNLAIKSGYASELIQVSEALQEKKIVEIAEEINRRYQDPERPCRVVLITGPSSSGKTTFCKRPKFPDGRYDFDNISAVDSETMVRDLNALLRGERVEVPEFNFKTGLREYNGKKLKMGRNSLLLIEGIHALNPALTSQIEESLKFRIYISCLTSISLDDHNWIPTSDCRLLRRIIRDYNVGAFTAQQTIAQWPSVCDGEMKWIFPYQETADVMFNSALHIEFAVLRNHAEPILASVPKNSPEYCESHRLLKFIHYFVAVSDKEIPPTSIMREFVGGSSFKYSVSPSRPYMAAFQASPSRPCLAALVPRSLSCPRRGRFWPPL